MQFGRVFTLISKEARDGFDTLLDTGLYNGYDMDSWNRVIQGEINVPYQLQQQLAYYDKSHTLHICDLQDFPRCDKLDDAPSENGHIELFTVPPGTKVLAMDEDTGKLCFADVAVLSRHHGCKIEIVNLMTKRQILTDDDPRAIYGIDPHTLDYVRCRPTEAMDRKIFVPVAKEVPSFRDLLLDDSPDVPCHMDIPVGADNVRSRITLDTQSGYFFGAMVGDGWCRHDKGTAVAVEFASSYPEVDESFRWGLESIMEGDYHLGYKWDGPEHKFAGSGGCGTTRLYRAPLAEWMTTQIGHMARNKHLPPFVWRAPLSFKLGLLSGLIDTDGTICKVKAKAKKKSQYQMSYGTSSLRLANELRHLLRELGVSSSISRFKSSTSGNNAWILTISTYDIRQVEGLNFRHPSKAELFAELQATEMKLSPVSTRYDVLPIPSGLAEALGDALTSKRATPYSAARKAVKDNYIGRDTARRILDIVGEDERVIEHSLFSRWKSLLDNDTIIYDRIRSVEKTDQVEVGYDLTVPGYETFMSHEGVVLSNTMNFHVPVSQDAVREANEKLLLSKNLLSPATFKSHLKPTQEFLLGLHLASRDPDKSKETRVFQNREEAMKAFRRGELNMTDPIRILEK